MTRVSQLWDLIGTWDFCVDDPCDFSDIPISPHKKFTKPNITQPLKNCDFSQFFGHNSSLGLDRSLGFSCGWPLWLSWYSYITSKKLPNQTSCNLLKFVFFAFFCHNTSLGLDRYQRFSHWMTLVTFLIFLYHLTKNCPNQKSYFIWPDLTQSLQMILTWFHLITCFYLISPDHLLLSDFTWYHQTTY